jgi:hypothetical protein
MQLFNYSPVAIDLLGVVGVPPSFQPHQLHPELRTLCACRAHGLRFPRIRNAGRSGQRQHNSS